jgi:hypothetical protein
MREKSFGFCFAYRKIRKVVREILRGKIERNLRKKFEKII